MTRHDNDAFAIPKVDLEQYRFSPPGPMGWSASEYEKILDDPEKKMQESASFAPPAVPSATLIALPQSSAREAILSQADWEKEEPASESTSEETDKGADENKEEKKEEDKKGEIIQNKEAEKKEERHEKTKKDKPDRESLSAENGPEGGAEALTEEQRDPGTEAEQEPLQEEDDESDFIRSPNPPAPPWLNKMNLF
ncbi:hypothetical protein EWH99_05335 [Sporolactobacillus sp. THM7-7]|nr:hypothetical protein EWH99_05335 [Sporolactobacillus sp. THM7-7]